MTQPEPVGSFHSERPSPWVLLASPCVFWPVVLQAHFHAACGLCKPHVKLWMHPSFCLSSQNQFL